MATQCVGQCSEYEMKRNLSIGDNLFCPNYPSFTAHRVIIYVIVHFLSLVDSTYTSIHTYFIFYILYIYTKHLSVVCNIHNIINSTDTYEIIVVKFSSKSPYNEEKHI